MHYLFLGLNQVQCFIMVVLLTITALVIAAFIAAGVRFGWMTVAETIEEYLEVKKVMEARQEEHRDMQQITKGYRENGAWMRTTNDEYRKRI